jgi:hypothetical protein
MAREAYSKASRGYGYNETFCATVARMVGNHAGSWGDLATRFEVEAAIMRQAQSYCEDMAKRNGEEL